MALQRLVLDVPDHVLRRLELRAEQTKRSVEDEILMLVAEAMPAEAELPAELERSLEELEVLDAAALFRAANHAFDVELGQELENLNLKQQREGLTEPEQGRQRWLLEQYERVLLTRARATALLAQQGGESQNSDTP